MKRGDTEDAIVPLPDDGYVPGPLSRGLQLDDGQVLTFGLENGALALGGDR